MSSLCLNQGKTSQNQQSTNMVSCSFLPKGGQIHLLCHINDLHVQQNSQHIQEGASQNQEGQTPSPCSRAPERNPDKASHLSLYQVLSQHFVTYVTKKILFLLLYNFLPQFHNYNMLSHCSLSRCHTKLAPLQQKKTTKYKAVIYSIIYSCTTFSP